MNSPDWAEIGTAFDELAGKTPHDRAIHLEQLKQRNSRLAEELTSLLKAHDLADGFIENKVQRVLTSIAPLVELSPGERVLHFEIIELLGTGSLAKVYLARDTELERFVALKVTLSNNKEARTLAHFCIDGIVQIHSEHLIEREGEPLRLMCIQYISGPNLAELQRELKIHPQKSLIQILDQFPQRKVALETASLKWRETLATLTAPEAIVLLGSRLAEILGHAHSMGVLHLDIKPANILVDPYGRPYLSDFNVSTHTDRLSQGDVQGLGGTPHYMPPEQAQFFKNQSLNAAATLDARSDIYALGIVLKDLLAAVNFENSKIEKILEHATNRNQLERTASAFKLAGELKAWLCGNLAEKEMPRLWRGLRWVLKYPMTALVSLSVLSQVAASIINISYNRLQIMSALSPEQNEIFLHCVSFYNAVTYPLTVLIGVILLRPLFQKNADPNRARRTALKIPLIMFLAVSFGWLPGAFIFPIAIDQAAGPIPDSIYWQFAGSFSLAWLSSMTTLLAVSTFVLSRSLYPRYWQGESRLAAKELRSIARINRSLPFASALIPMCGVLLVILLAPQQISDYGAFKILLLLIVGCGLINLLVVQRLSRYVEHVFSALKRPRSFD